MIYFLIGNYNWFTTTISIFNALTILALIFFERKDPDRVIKWLGVLLFLPLVGFISYLAFGKGPSLGRRRKVLSKLELDDNYLNALSLQSKEIDNTNVDNYSNVSEMIRYNIVENKSILTSNNDVKYYSDMQVHFKDLFEDIKNAKEYINIIYFIIKPDSVGKHFIDLLTQKQKEGVQVRLVYDDFGSILVNTKFFRGLKEAGGKVFPFFPFRFRPFGGNLNYRNHRKIVVIDGDISYVGGSNIAKEYLGYDKRLTPWRDTHLRIIGNAVSMLNVRFLQDYNFASGENVVQEIKYCEETVGDEMIQIVSDGPDSQSVGIETAYIKSIYCARKSVILQTPYLVLDEPFKLALISAVKSGINVKIMIPGIPDKRFVYSSTMSNAIELYNSGVEIYIHKGFLHSKSLCIDNEISSVGTFNLDIRSFKLHFEVTAFMYGENIAECITKDFEEETKNCKMIDDKFIKDRTIFEKFKERIAILFSPLF